MVAYASATSKSSVNSPAPSKMLRLFALYENLTRFVMPLCSAVPGRPNPETPVDQSNNIVDISKVGLKQFWNLRSHMQDASTLATAHYPETLDRIFVNIIPPLLSQRPILQTNSLSRSSAPLHFSQPSGAGSKNGLTPSPLQKYSYSLPTKYSPLLQLSSTLKTSPKSLVVGSTLKVA